MPLLAHLVGKVGIISAAAARSRSAAPVDLVPRPSRRHVQAPAIHPAPTFRDALRMIVCPSPKVGDGVVLPNHLRMPAPSTFSRDLFRLLHDEYGSKHGDELPTVHFRVGSQDLPRLLAGRIKAHVSNRPAPPELVARLALYDRAAAQSATDYQCRRELDKTAHLLNYFGCMLNAFIRGGGVELEGPSSAASPVSAEQLWFSSGYDVGPGTTDLQLGTSLLKYAVVEDKPKLDEGQAWRLIDHARRGLSISLQDDVFHASTLGQAKSRSINQTETSILVQAIEQSFANDAEWVLLRPSLDALPLRRVAPNVFEWRPRWRRTSRKPSLLSFAECILATSLPPLAEEAQIDRAEIARVGVHVGNLHRAARAQGRDADTPSKRPPSSQRGARRSMSLPASALTAGQMDLASSQLGTEKSPVSSSISALSVENKEDAGKLNHARPSGPRHSAPRDPRPSSAEAHSAAKTASIPSFFTEPRSYGSGFYLRDNMTLSMWPMHHVACRDPDGLVDSYDIEDLIDGVTFKRLNHLPGPSIPVAPETHVGSCSLQLAEFLGRGSTGGVYTAFRTDPPADIPMYTRLPIYVFKIVDGSDPEAVARLLNEREAYATIQQTVQGRAATPGCYGIWTGRPAGAALDLYVMVLEHAGFMGLPHSSEDWNWLQPEKKSAYLEAYDAIHAAGVTHGDLQARHLYVTATRRHTVIDFSHATVNAHSEDIEDEAETIRELFGGYVLAHKIHMA